MAKLSKNVKLTKNVVDAKSPRPKAFYVWDDQIIGFGLKVLSTGRKTFVFKYRSQGGGQTGQQRWYMIGVYGGIAVDQARKVAIRLAALVSDGKDPQNDRLTMRGAPLLQEIWERFEKEHAPKRKAATQRNYSIAWRLHVKPDFGHRKIDSISRKDMIALHARLSKKSPCTANRVMAFMSKLFNMAEKWELKTEGINPCRHVSRNPEIGRDRFLSADELKRLAVALRVGLEAHTENHYMVAAIQLLLLTGARVSEILGTQWDWVDLDKRVIALPDSKTGKKLLYLSEPAVQIIGGLKLLPKSVGQPFMIRGRLDGKPLEGLRQVWQRVSERANIKGARLHDLRHTAASIGVNGGLTLPIIGKVLGHTQASTTQRYSHVDTNPALAAVDLIGEAVKTAFGDFAYQGTQDADGLVEAAE